MKTILLATTAVLALLTSADAAPLTLTSVSIMPTDDVLSPGLAQVPVAEGRYKLENPSKYIGYYGYGLDGPLAAAPNAVPSKDKKVEATKTEPDKNTYLVLTGA